MTKELKVVGGIAVSVGVLWLVMVSGFFSPEKEPRLTGSALSQQYLEAREQKNIRQRYFHEIAKKEAKKEAKRVDEFKEAKKEAKRLNKPQLDLLAKDVSYLINVGAITQINPYMNEVLVNPAIWNDLEYGTKEEIGRKLALYCGYTKGNNLFWVDIKDAYTGKKIAKYSKSWGFKVY